MGDNKKEDLEAIAEKYKKRNKYINEWQKNKYYRLTVLIPLAEKDQLLDTAKRKGFKTVSDYVKALIENDNNSGGDFSGLPETNSYFDSGLPFG